MLPLVYIHGLLLSISVDLLYNFWLNIFLLGLIHEFWRYWVEETATFILSKDDTGLVRDSILLSSLTLVLHCY